MDVYYNNNDHRLEIGPHFSEYIEGKSFVVMRHGNHDMLKEVLGDAIRTGRLEHFPIRRGSIRDYHAALRWPDWLIIEHAVFRHFVELVDRYPINGVRTPGYFMQRRKEEVAEVAEYLAEKLPHIHLAYNAVQDHLVMTAIPRVSMGMWEKVLLPSLRRYAERGRYNTYYALSPDEERYNVKLYIVWNRDGAAYQISWPDVTYYFSMPDFVRWITKSPEYNPMKHLAI